jgi:hypothetical protein
MRAALLMVLALAQFPSARQALDLGRTRDDAMFAAFNRGYELPVADPLERAEVITEFRRAVLMVRDQYNVGDFGFTERDLVKAMTPYDGQVAFVAEARLSPLHTYAKPPTYELYVATGPGTKPLAAKSLKRDPVYPPGLGMGSSFVGVRLEGAFSRADIETASAPMLTVTDEKANVLWQARIELSRYR